MWIRTIIKINYTQGCTGNLKTIDGSFEKLEIVFLILIKGTQIPYYKLIKIEIN